MILASFSIQVLAILASWHVWAKYDNLLLVLFQLRFVEIGRVAYIAYGPDQGKLCAIVDVIDQNRVS
jgi:hypothetical protein